jgi:putative ABC transport system permease protein
MLTITLQDLRYRWRQFLIAVIGAGLTFAMALLLSGLAESFHTEVERTVGSVGADAWVVPHGMTGPFTGLGFLPNQAVGTVRGMSGVKEADPLLVLPVTTLVKGQVEGARLFGFTPGALGTPPIAEGRMVSQPGEVIVDESLGLGLGDSVEFAGKKLTIVGRSHGLTLFGGVPNVYTSLDDAQAIAGNQPFITTVVTRGVPAEDGDGQFTVLTPKAVEADTVHALGDAIASINSTRALMWIVAAIIVGALMYVSALERVRDFAVLKSLGSSSSRLFLGVAAQAVLISLLAAVFAVGAAKLMSPAFALPTAVPSSAYLALPFVAVLVGLLSSLVALRRAVAVDPASAFASAS